MKRSFFALGVIFFIFSVQGCAAVPVHRSAVDGHRPLAAVRFFYTLDKAVQKARVRDASSYPVRGFPELRTNRFLTAMKTRLTDAASRTAWARNMRELALKSQEKEIQNLPSAELGALARQANLSSDRGVLVQKLHGYSLELFERDRRREDFFETLKENVNDQDEYSFVMRALGAYPVVSFIVKYATVKAQRQFAAWYKQPPDEITVHGTMISFKPENPAALSIDKMNALFVKNQPDALGIPSLNNTDIQLLIRALAPVYHVDVTADYDRFGQIEWKNNKVSVNPRLPAVYYYITYAFYKNQPALQINYVTWFSERNGPYAPWMERGPLDGITVRVTLNAAGEPVLADVMNNCGCYHFFVPRRENVEKIVSRPFAVDPFVPVWLPDQLPQDHLQFYVKAGWHQIYNIAAGDMPQEAAAYQLLPYDILEALPHPDGRTESVFNASGIMKSSSRVEPYIFFSMGIPKVGYMRQRGHHAIKMAGKEFFSDPELFDKNFVFKEQKRNNGVIEPKPTQ